jgi:amidase
VLGFLTRTVEDTALMLDVAAASPPELPYSTAASRPPDRLRVALWMKTPFPPVPVDASVRASLEGVAETLRALGHEVVDADPRYGRATDSLTSRYLSGIAQDAARMARPARLQRRTRGFARIGGLLPGALLDKAMRDEADHAARIGELFRDHDVLLTPVSTRPPVDAAQWEGMGAARTLLGMARVYPYTGIWNMTGQPAISVPAPPTDEGLPVGAQLVAPADGEPLLLSLAAQLERELGWPARRPPV